MALKEQVAIIVQGHAFPGLQPVLLPRDAWTEFSHEMTAALERLEAEHRPARRVDPSRVSDAKTLL